MKRFRSVVAAVVVTSLGAANAFAARGSADFTRYVALGDSFGAGVSNSSLVLTHQQYSYPNLIARQAGVPPCSSDPANCFQQPLVSEPGIGPELVLQSLVPAPRIVPKATTNGSPLNLNLPRPYNNLSIPGARVRDLLALTGAQPATSTPTVFAQFILRGLGTAPDQASALRPTFISVWIGGNDVLGAVLAGTPAALTPAADFARDYAALLDRLIAANPNAGMITASVADVSALPYASTLPAVLVNPATGRPVLGPDGRPIPFIADLGGGTIGPLPTGSLVLLPASSFLATGFGFPAALRPLFPNLPDVGKPLPDALVLTPTEITAINARVKEVNDSIFSIARARNIPVVDMQGVLSRLRTGINYAGVRLSNAFLTGGVFSYDGFHPTDLGYALIANEFIRVINHEYDVHIPLVSITEFFANNAPPEASAVFPIESFEFTAAALQSLLSVAGNDERIGEAPVEVRRRGSR
jgi:lysophospholipase L1-like esterase